MTRQYMDFAPVKKRTVRMTGVSEVHTDGSQVVAYTVQASAPKVRTAVPQQSSRPMMAMPSANATLRSRTGMRPAQTRRVAQTRSVSGNVGGNNVAMRKMPSSAVVARANTAGTRNVAMVSAGKRSTTTVRRVATNNNLSAGRGQVKLGEIEDLSPKFVTTNVPKRPLGDGSSRSVPPQEEAKVAKQKKVGGRLKSKKAAKAAAKQEKAQKKAASREAYKVPKTPFINQDKVAKRPLSKNVYQQQPKKVVAPVEKKTNGKPVTIITKPKKDSKVGLVVTIILTIILGAVAGTVAFLLLPK